MTPSPCPIAVLHQDLLAEALRLATKKPDLVSFGHASVAIKTIP
jgi:hypothetical protein